MYHKHHSKALFNSLLMNGHTLGFHILTRQLDSHFIVKQTVPQESTAQWFSLEWSHYEVSHTNSKVTIVGDLTTTFCTGMMNMPNVGILY